MNRPCFLKHQDWILNDGNNYFVTKMVLDSLVKQAQMCYKLRPLPQVDHLNFEEHQKLTQNYQHITTTLKKFQP